MPPQLHQSSIPILNPLLRFSPPSSPNDPKHQRFLKMPKFTVRKLIPLLIFVLSTLSVLRLLRISFKSASSSSASRSSSTTFQLSSDESSQQIKANVSESVLTEKELKLLSDTITNRSPCNVLVFGFAPQYKLLRHARANPACRPNMNQHGDLSDCKLELRDLPHEVQDIQWDVIVVDGPRGDDLEAPGRMGSIYTAAVLARKGSSNSTTDVFVHDVHRTAEKWFSRNRPDQILAKFVDLIKSNLFAPQFDTPLHVCIFVSYQCRETHFQITS